MEGENEANKPESGGTAQADSSATAPLSGEVLAPEKPRTKPPRPGKAAGRKKTTRKQTRKKTTARRRRRILSFPVTPFEEALKLPQAIERIAAGEPVRRLTLLDKLGRSPDSSATRQLITTSSKYGLTKGSYKADRLELTPDGRVAVGAEVPRGEQLAARFRLAVENVAPFKALYDRFKGNKLPAQAVLRDFLLDEGYRDEEVQQCVDTFIVNAKFLGLLSTVAGAERLLTIDHVLEDAPATLDGVSHVRQAGGQGSGISLKPSTSPLSETTDWGRTCFYITPIGDPDSEERQHSDLFLSSLVEPALTEFELNVVRADHIGKPGMITSQIIEYLMKARLVVADLSFHNPNVFYELCLPHVSRLPTVQLIRSADPIPFDLDQFRTIRIDTTSIYTLVPRLEVYKAEISNQARQVLNDPDAVDNPLTTFYPALAPLAMAAFSGGSPRGDGAHNGQRVDSGPQAT